MAAYNAANGQWQAQRGFPYQHPHPQQQQQQNNPSTHPDSFLQSPFANGAGGYQTEPQSAPGRGAQYNSGFSDAHQHPAFMHNGQPHNHQFGINFSSVHDSSLADAITLPPRQTFLSTSPEPINSTHPRSIGERMPVSVPATPSSGVKRSRTDDSDANDGDKTKTSACLRCRGQKVRCEMITEGERCKRCLNGDHECVIPGPKKRRVPPKREDLIKKIQEQAEAINKLMSRLSEVEATQNDGLHAAGGSAWSSGDPGSPSYLSEHGPLSAHPVDPNTNQVVENWISKARESLAEFGGLIGMGGGGQLNEFIVARDPERFSSDDEADDEYDFAVIDSEGNNVSSYPRRPLIHRGSSSSIGSDKARPDGIASANLPNPAVPFGLMANLSLKAQKVRGGDDDSPVEALGVARDDFFRTKSSTESAPSSRWPPILADGVISPSDAQALFKIFFDFMNVSVSLVDPIMYTVETTIFRSPFLFTVICAIASRYYTAASSPDLYGRAMQYAQSAAGSSLISGSKNVESVIAYILLSLYPIPSKRWEEERGWLYLGLAIRIAVDINLHLPSTVPPQSEKQAREQLNRTRVWLNCHNLDRSTGSQYGKAAVLRNDDYIAAHSEDWWKTSQFNLPDFDVHICAYNAELRVMGNFRAKIYSDPSQPTGLNKNVDLRQLAVETDEELRQLEDKWFGIILASATPDKHARFRVGLLRLAYSYARLCCLSYGFHYAFSKKNVDETQLFDRCLETACIVARTITEDLGHPDHRALQLHGPDAQRVFGSFAAAFMIKLTQHKYARFLSAEKRTEVLQLVQNLINLFDSPDVSIDAQHGPKLYARFLQSLLNATDTTGRPRGHQQRSPSMQTKTDGLSRESPIRSQSSSPASLGFSSAFEMVGVHGDVEAQYPSYMATPLPFGGDEIKTMMNVTDPQVWSDMVLPGYGWMAPPPANMVNQYDDDLSAMLYYGNSFSSQQGQ